MLNVYVYIEDCCWEFDARCWFKVYSMNPLTRGLIGGFGGFYKLFNWNANFSLKSATEVSLRQYFTLGFNFYAFIHLPLIVVWRYGSPIEWMGEQAAPRRHVCYIRHISGFSLSLCSSFKVNLMMQLNCHIVKCTAAALNVFVWCPMYLAYYSNRWSQRYNRVWLLKWAFRLL